MASARTGVHGNWFVADALSLAASGNAQVARLNLLRHRDRPEQRSPSAAAYFFSPAIAEHGHLTGASDG